jgi:competence protein ComEA
MSSLKPSGSKGRAAPVGHAPFPFDPNTLDEQGWLALGLSRGKVGTLLKYRSRGGRFRRPEDLARVYSLAEDEVARLLPYVRIRATEARQGGMDPAGGKVGFRYDRVTLPEAPRRKRVEVNSADSQAWVRLPGIGPGLASRILRFRRRLGGFLSVGQVAETYGLPDSVFQSIRPFLDVDTSKVQPWVDVNQATVEQLASHPYVSYRVAKAIVAYRGVHGPFGRVDDLGRLALVPSDLLERIRPYVRLE